MVASNGPNQGKTRDLPIGRCVHSSAERIRLRVKEKQGDEIYFNQVLQTLRAAFPKAKIEVNPLTGSVLCIGIERFEDLARAAREKHLFQITALPPRVTATKAVHRGVAEMNATIRRSSGGELDLSSLVFLILIGTGIYQVVRGNLGLPPWYTAFWYALGVCTKSVSDESHDPKQGFEL
ncbi:MAG: hypothetical protein ACLFPG_07640 [Desulfohalobiaceae bacterium]